jgi:hypothetical protein
MVLRMNEIYPQNVFSKETNPLSPTIMCNAFSQSVACLAVDMEIKLIVYKLFDKYVVRNIGRLYHDINEMFIAAGILPTIKYKMPVVKASGSSAPNQRAKLENEEPVQAPVAAKPQTGSQQVASAPAAAASAQATIQGPANVFESMRAALYQYRGEPLPHSPHPVSSDAASISQGLPGAPEAGTLGGSEAPGSTATNPDAAGMVFGGNAYYVTSDIISGLSSIQNNTAIASFYGGSQNSGEVIKNKVLQAVVSTQGGDDERSLNTSDADVIDIVSMMFDYILNDKSIPERTKTVIARLQIPLVKVAILDKTFFSKKSHPARALLNELAYASNVLDSEYDDADTLFAEVERVVGRVLDDFDSNIELFAELLNEFQDFLATEVQANKLAEQMVLDVKQKVADEIEKRLRRHKVPAAVNRFIVGPWKDVMNIIGIRDGCEGIAWNTTTTFLDDLIWSVQPKLFGEDRKQLSRLIPRILPSIREGLALLDNSEFDVPAFLQKLQQLHLRALHVEQDSAKSRDSFMVELMNDIESQENQHDRFEFDMNDPQLQQSQFFNAVNTMAVGTWVEFEAEQGKQCGKLTWKCDFTGEYTFMNRMYKVVADIGMRELINRMESGHARIVEDVPLFDRAVDAIISGMKHMTGGAGQAQPAAN